MNVRELMTDNVQTIEPQTTLKDAAAQMSALDVGFLPVVENDVLAGVLTDRDIVVRAVALGLDPAQSQAKDFMTRDPLTCDADDDVDMACQRMKDKQVRRLIVTQKGKAQIGVIALGDLAAHRATGDEAGEVLQQVSEPGMH